jgi:hypothetical protein
MTVHKQYQSILYFQKLLGYHTARRNVVLFSTMGKYVLPWAHFLKTRRPDNKTVTYLLTYSMQQSPSWEANRFAASQKLPTAFYGTRRFIAAFTSARHLSLYWASSIQSITPHPTSWKSILILSFHLRLGLYSGLFPSGFPTKTLYTPLPSTNRPTCPAHLILLGFITRTIVGEEYRSWVTEVRNSFRPIRAVWLAQ